MQGSVDIVKMIIVKDFKLMVVVLGEDVLLDFPGGHLEGDEVLAKILSGRCQRK